VSPPCTSEYSRRFLLHGLGTQWYTRYSRCVDFHTLGTLHTAGTARNMRLSRLHHKLRKNPSTMRGEDGKSCLQLRQRPYHCNLRPAHTCSVLDCHASGHHHHHFVLSWGIRCRGRGVVSELCAEGSCIAFRRGVPPFGMVSTQTEGAGGRRRHGARATVLTATTIRRAAAVSFLRVQLRIS